MLGHSFAFSAAPIRKVKEVQFGILSPEEIVSRVAYRLITWIDLPCSIFIESCFSSKN